MGKKLVHFKFSPPAICPYRHKGQIGPCRVCFIPMGISEDDSFHFCEGYEVPLGLQILDDGRVFFVRGASVP